MAAGGPPPDLPVGAVAAEWSQRHSTRSLSVRVLGPLSVTLDDRTVALGGTKERLVLVHLLARANAVVSVDALVEGVWAGRPPRSAARTLQSYVARLRRELEPRPGQGGGPRGPGGARVAATGSRSRPMSWTPSVSRNWPGWAPSNCGGATTAPPPPCGMRWDLWRGEAYGEFGDVEVVRGRGPAPGRAPPGRPGGPVRCRPGRRRRPASWWPSWRRWSPSTRSGSGCGVS